ncbi:unnamed protein product, partial [marine sediment metagenome]
PGIQQAVENMDSGSAKNAVRNDETFFDFHVSQAAIHPTGVYK